MGLREAAAISLFLTTEEFVYYS